MDRSMIAYRVCVKCHGN